MMIYDDFIFPRYSSSMKSLSNKFMHLTNYSINKKNEGAYQANSDETVCQGHKWYVFIALEYLPWSLYTV